MSQNKQLSTNIELRHCGWYPTRSEAQKSKFVVQIYVEDICLLLWLLEQQIQTVARKFTRWLGRRGVRTSSAKV